MQECIVEKCGIVCASLTHRNYQKSICSFNYIKRNISIALIDLSMDYGEIVTGWMDGWGAHAHGAQNKCIVNLLTLMGKFDTYMGSNG